jgi:hypothetical protein
MLEIAGGILLALFILALCTPSGLSPKPPPFWQGLWDEWSGKAQAARARHIAEMEWLNNEHQS